MRVVLPLVWLVLVVLMIASAWRVFTKAGKPGWACLVPFYNLYVMLQMTGQPGWYLLLFFIPLVNVVMMIVLAVKLAGVFGQGVGFAIGMILLPVVFYPILGFGDAVYTAPPPAPASA